MVRLKLGISFLGTMTLFMSMIVFHELIYGHSVFEHMDMNTVAMVFIYMVVGLSIDKHTGVSDLVDRIMYIQGNGDSEDAKLQLIKSFIELNVSKWVAYWHLYEEIVQGKKSSGKVGRLFSKIWRGSLSFVQFLWITCYIIFNVFKGHIPLLSSMSLDIAFMIDFVGLGFFILTSGDILGTKEFMTILFESIKPGSDKTVGSTLKLLEANIEFGARQYGFMNKKHCENNNNEVK
jgi:hypothetical protein